MRQAARRRGERAATVVLATAGPVAALATLAVCVLAALLAPFGLWRPVIVLPMMLPAGAVVVRVARWIPVPAAPRAPVWPAVACVVIAVGFAVWAARTHSEHLVLRRDAGSYALYAHWLATHHGLPVDAKLPAFGGPAALSVPGFGLDSPAYYQVLTGSHATAGAQVVPQFLIGAPALYSLGWWLAGWTGLFTAPAVLGGLAVLAAGSATARLVGARWAPVAALALALTQPVLHASRATLSEPVAALLVLGAAALTTDALDAATPRDRVRRVAVVAGALLGLAGLVRIDAVRDVALLLPVCAALALRRHPAAVPLGVAALAGAVLSGVPAVWLARPYLATVAASLRPLVLATAGLAVLSAVVVVAHRRWGHRWERPDRAPAPAGRLLPGAAGALVVLLGAALAARPLGAVVRQAPDDPGDALVASLQQQQHLPVDGARTYAERSVEWLTWYVGVPVALAALAALAVTTALALRWWLRARPGEGAPPPRWLVPAVVGLGSAALTLYRPGITPDHPWADRRLVPVVLPVAVIAATATAVAAVRLARRARGRLPAVLVPVVVVAAVTGLAWPAWSATRPVARTRTEVGEPQAVADVCHALRPGDVVVGVGDAGGGSRAQNEWVQVIRGVCGHPSGALRAADPAANRTSLAALAAMVGSAGGRLVLLSAGEDDGSAARALAELGLRPRRAVLAHTTEDQHLLERRPDGVTGLVIDVWLADWTGADGGSG